MAAESILLIRLSAMGDVAMSAPVIIDLCNQHRDKHFYLLTTPFFAPFFPEIENLTILDINVKKQCKNLFSLLSLAYSLQKTYSFSKIIDLHDVLRTKVIRWTIGLLSLYKVKISHIDKGRKEKKRLLNPKTQADHSQLMLMTDRYASTLTKAGFPVELSHSFQSKRQVPQNDVVPSEKNGDVWIGISPFAQHQGKIYPISNMLDIAMKLVAQGNVHIFVFGGGDEERRIAETISDGHKKISSVIGVMPLKDELALISNLDIMISMDSSAMHMASLYGVRVVSIWGATHPYAGFLGYGQSIEDVVQKESLKCRPCSIYGDKPCRLGNYACMDINPDEVLKVVMRDA
ncbi:MAG: glycosyltransferase family 9 protein [Marinilabiliaceae bacterium]|nr:glycosyltransferase family 9 protein [Marinilabiliaceae bacterium]